MDPSSSMKANDVKVAVSHFLDLVVNGRGTEDETIDALEVSLDMLAWIQNLVDPVPGEPHLDSLEHEYEKMRTLVAQQFPSFGQYGAPVRLTDENGAAPAEECDAIDDLAEIACRLYEVAWRFQNTSESDAVAVFAESYRDVWRARLRALQWYLEARRTHQA